MDLSRLRQGERIAGAAGLALFLIMFLPWFGLAGDESVTGSSEGFSAWQSFDVIDLFLLLTVVAAVGLAVIRATQTSVEIPATPAMIVTALGAFTTLLVLYRLLNPPGSEGIDRKFGLFLGFLAVAAVAVGGYLAMQEEGSSFGDVGSGGTGGGTRSGGTRR